jgi:hypothetical protein
VEVAKKTIELMEKHLEESSTREAKLIEIDVRQQNMQEALTRGNDNFEQLFDIMGSLKADVTSILHSLRGNGVEGIYSMIKRHDLVLKETEQRCSNHKDAIELVAEHEKFINQIRGMATLVKFAGVAVIIYVITNLIKLFNVPITNLIKALISML